jgi:hypothetical protein
MSLQVIPTSGSAVRSGGVTVALLIVLGAAAGYALHEHSVANRLAAQNNDVTAALNATRGQLEELTTKLNAMSAARPADRAPASAAPAVAYRRPLVAASHRHRIEDPRWNRIQGQLDEQKKQIESTQQDLASARTDLTGSIARTHDELVLLEKKGERSYFEFDLDKASQFQHDGPVGVRLRKANTKHEYADLELLVDDYKLTKKHVNIYEPVVFYAGDSKQPVELVINSISKNHIHGYVSASKYKPSELETMAANSPAGNSGSTANGQQNASPASSPSDQRRRLEVPKTTDTKPSPDQN